MGMTNTNLTKTIFVLMCLFVSGFFARITWFYHRKLMMNVRNYGIYYQKEALSGVVARFITEEPKTEETLRTTTITSGILANRLCSKTGEKLRKF